MAETYVTLAIHTYDRAVALRDLLKENDIPAQLENVNIKQPSPACGVRVRVPESKLPAALRIVERNQDAAPGDVITHLEGEDNRILVPVDFSNGSLNSVKAAFAFASAIDARIDLLHVFTTPYFDGSLSISDNFTLDIRDADTRKQLSDTAHTNMRKFRGKIEALVDSAELPAVSFRSYVREGLPEDIILDLSRTKPPLMIVMNTRGVEKKAQQLVGSVAAEVLDSCRVPVMTVPDNFEFKGFASISPVAFFCNVDQHDLLAMDLFIQFFGTSKKMTVNLLPVNEKAGSKLKGRMEALLNYFSERYPSFIFKLLNLRQGEFKSHLETLYTNDEFKMLVVPNAKKNIFSRLFNPGIAHKVVFEADVPMLALPV